MFFSESFDAAMTVIAALTSADWSPMALSAVFAALILLTVIVILITGTIFKNRQLKLLANMNANGFLLTIRAIGDAVIVTDADTRITIMNPVAERLTGFTQSEALGKPLTVILKLRHALTGLPVESPLIRTIATGAKVDLADHTILIARDGKRRHIADCAAPIHDAFGQLTGAVMVFRDVSAEYEKREQLRLCNLQLATAAEVGKMVYFQCDSEVRIVSDAATMGDQWGYDENGRALPSERWVSAEDQVKFQLARQRLLAKTGTDEELSYRVETAQGVRYFEMRLRANPDAEPGQPAYFGIIRDVTSFREDEQRHSGTSHMLQALLDNLPCHVFVKDYENANRYLLISRFFAENMHRTIGDIQGKTDAEIFPPEVAARVTFDDKMAMDEAKPLEVIEKMPFADGRSHTILTSKRPLEHGGRSYLLGIGLDITELTENREQLKAEINRERVLNSCLELLMLHENEIECINIVLETICNYMHTDCTYVLNFDWKHNLLAPAYEFYADENAPRIPRATHLPESRYESWLRKLARHEDLVYADFANDPEAQAALGSRAEAARRDDVRSLYYTGIFVENHLWGCLGLAYRGRQYRFRDEDTQMHQAAAHLIEIILSRLLTRRGGPSAG